MRLKGLAGLFSVCPFSLACNTPQWSVKSPPAAQCPFSFSVQPHDFHSGNEAERSTGSLSCPLSRARNTTQRSIKTRLTTRMFFDPASEFILAPRQGGLPVFWLSSLPDFQVGSTLHNGTDFRSYFSRPPMPLR